MKKIKRFRYLIAIGLFFTWMLLFDSNNILKQIEYTNTLKKLDQEREYYLTEVRENQSSTNELITNIDKLERYAREKYLMKRDNEDIFLVIDENETKEMKETKSESDNKE